MKHFKELLLGLFLMLIISASVAYADCPMTNCTEDCGSTGTGCQITQTVNGVICSTTWCNGKRGNIE